MTHILAFKSLLPFLSFLAKHNLPTCSCPYLLTSFPISIKWWYLCYWNLVSILSEDRFHYACHLTVPSVHNLPPYVVWFLCILLWFWEGSFNDRIQDAMGFEMSETRRLYYTTPTIAHIYDHDSCICLWHISSLWLASFSYVVVLKILSFFYFLFNKKVFWFQQSLYCYNSRNESAYIIMFNKYFLINN